jgi:NADPH2:quinone reductase
LAATGKLDVHVHKTYSLAHAAQAHIDLAGRSTSGKLLLLPS